MGHQKKLILDIVMGAAIPLALLSKGEAWLGLSPRWVFVAAGLVPALYVLWDVCFFTKRFNAITSVIAVTAVTQGGLAFLKVDGWKYALADSAGTFLTFLLFGLLLATGRPILQYFMFQAMFAETPEEIGLGWQALRSRPVYRAMVLGTLIILAENLLRASVNLWITGIRVTAIFGSPEFNEQKRDLEAITRFVFMASSMGAMVLGYLLPARALDEWIGEAAEEGGTLFEQIARKLGRPLPTKPAPTPQPEPVNSPT